jgi:hypothetical protein
MNDTWKRLLKFAALPLVVLALVAFTHTEVAAQVKAALVRDIDTPALSPFRAVLDFSWIALQEDKLLTTVPAGKRLVIEHLSYRTLSTGGDQFVAGVLKIGYFGFNPEVYLQINPPHASWNGAAWSEQDGSQPVKAYFDAGTEVWLVVHHNTNNTRYLTLVATGYYVTP